MAKIYLNKNVLEAAKERIAYTFDNFEKIYISFSGGKDSTVLLHLVMQEAIKRNRKIGLLFIDWECQFDLTINHIKKLIDTYSEYLDVYWTQFEILTNNSTSMFEPTWKSWDESKKELWTRAKENSLSITDGYYFPFYFNNITFEEFIALFVKWYSQDKTTATFVGIRAQESLNRFRAISKDDKFNYNNKKFTTKVVDDCWNVYPLYDWKVDDIWTFFAKTKLSYNEIYDRMHLAGLKPSQMRVDEPFGDEARKNLWLYHIIESHTWVKIVARMNGVNSGSLYSQESGNILGNIKISLPKNHTWKSFSHFLLNTMPPKTAEHYKNKIAVYLKWYVDKGFPNDIPDQDDWKLEQEGKVPTWRQIAKTLLKNDYWCRNLGFAITKSSAYEKYLKLMQRKRNEWNILN
jgi:3'-phosphoadenosine 5'-phosphosulfate sulfotransferase (PAPS reductase)/FAD synthetase